MPQPQIRPDKLAALQLIRSEGVGPATFARLVDRFGGVENALSAMPQMKRPLQPADLKKVEAEYNRLLKSGGVWLSKDDAQYPELMQPLDDMPPVLSALGDISLLAKPMIAMVGGRNASTNGRRLAAQIAKDLGRQGFVIVSGLARGIDTAAHEAALETGTVAVLANGVDIVYPPENKKLYDAIRERGVILSENPLASEPTASLFPRRNRIISGLCRGVIVVEAAQKSGSLITIRYALDQGREVFAVPGSPLDPRASGPNHLIKTGQAHLIESAQDVLDVLGGLRNLDLSGPQISFALDQVEAYMPETISDELPQNTAALTDDQARHTVLNYLSPTPCDIDHLTQATQLPASRLLAILMELELRGQIQRLAGNQVVRV
ncbi:MAG: putative Rossmann fold nucleotide-binding protein [Alphaproteobacteria bacterium]|nr:putative Rossmann fold nucleotide-binding protein [Alphaproteobacteria bacterium]